MLTKICGLTDINEAQYLKDNNVDFAGIVLFYKKSKRNTSIEKAKEIIKNLHPSVKVVAVTVCPSETQINEISEAGFDYIQIHGAIDEDIITRCPLPVLKAFNVSDIPEYDKYLKNSNIVGFVFDAGEPGSGKTFDWDMLEELKRDENKLYILAGGLNASNVKMAIERVNPDGVDVSSSVEYDDRLGKDPEKIKQFIENVR